MTLNQIIMFSLVQSKPRLSTTCQKGIFIKQLQIYLTTKTAFLYEQNKVVETLSLIKICLEAFTVLLVNSNHRSLDSLFKLHACVYNYFPKFSQIL